MNEKVLGILMHDANLGEEMVLHSLGAAISEPGADAQQWHTDSGYLFSDLVNFAGIGGHDLPSYAVTMMVPLLSMTNDHGPTEFCMGSSHLSGLDDKDDVDLEDERLEPIVESYDFTNDNFVCPSRRVPVLNFGDILLFDYQIVHRGGANSSPDLRTVMYMTYSREWFRDVNFRKKSYDEPIDEDDADWEEEEEARFLDKLTSSARFAIPDEFSLDEEDGDENNVSGTLEGIEIFLPDPDDSTPS